jgi:hypothetical protein
MCSCNNFVNNNDDLLEDETTLNFDGRESSLDFLDEIEYDNFLTKKMRERKKIQKELVAGGLDKKSAKQQSLEQIPRGKLKEVLGKLQNGETVTEIDGIKLDPKKAMEEVGGALGSGTDTPNTEKEEDDTKKGFFAKNGMYIGIAVVVVILGIFAYKKFSKK